MKKLIFLVLLFFACYAASAQVYPDYGLTRVRLIDSGKTIELEINPVKHEPAVKSGLFYYWYSANQLHSTQGGYSGQLLNGLYTEYYRNKNLKDQGTFNRGLKDGLWKSWNKDGTLKQEVNWDNGVVVYGKKPTFLQRLNFFKKGHVQPIDSVSKTHH